jgi:cell division protein FtsB
MGFVVFAGVVIFGVAVMFLPLIHERLAMQAESDRLDQEIARQETLEKKQKTEIEGLRTDASFVERTARDKLNLAKPGETIFRFEPAPAPPPRRRAGS